MKDSSTRRTHHRSPSVSPNASPERGAHPPKPVTAWPPWLRLAVSVFILWHLFALVIWQLPGTALYQKFSGPVRPYMTFTGMRQGWGVFSPNPSNLDVYVEARIRYADGQVRSWNYPRMVDLGYWERYQRERFRKFVEFGHLERYPMVWPSMARYAARRNNNDPGNPPARVELVRHFRHVPPPGLPMPSFRTYTFYRTPVSSEDLR